MQHQPKTMLVTGGAGFIGSNFIWHVLDQCPAIQIINLDKLTYAASLENLCNIAKYATYHFIHGDINDRELLADLFTQYNIDTIVHFAAESHVDRSIASPDAFVTTNVYGTFALLETARIFWGPKYQHVRFHHISTDEVYGSLEFNAPAFTEKSPYQPNSPYAASKAAADHLVRAYAQTYGLPITLSNCSNNYGPHQHQEKFIPTVIKNCLQRRPIPIYGHGKNIRDWLYVEDHCAALLAIIQHGKTGESYNIGGDNEWENLNLAQLICEQFDQRFPQYAPHNALLQFVQDRPGHDFRYAIDHHKTKQAFNWQPTMPMQEGITKTIAYYQEIFCHPCSKF